MALLPPIETESELSYAYLHAVAAVAGMSCEVTGRHADKMGIDAIIRASEQFADDSLLTDFALDVQLKATIGELTLKDGKISYFLKGVERYNKLRKTTVAPASILVVLFLPANWTSKRANWCCSVPKIQGELLDPNVRNQLAKSNRKNCDFKSAGMPTDLKLHRPIQMIGVTLFVEVPANNGTQQPRIASPNCALGLQRTRVILIDHPQIFLRLVGNFSAARRATNVDNLSAHDSPFWISWKLVLHHRAYSLSVGEVGVDGRPMFRAYSTLETALATNKHVLFADLDLDRNGVRAEFLARNGANLLHCGPQTVAL